MNTFTKVVIFLFVIACLLLGLAVLLTVNPVEAAVEFSEAQEGCLVISEVAWAGTEASASDEWYEIENICGVPVSTEGFYLQTVNADLEQSQAYLPLVDIPANGLCLFERTDDYAVATQQACGINGSAGTGDSLTGIFTNGNVVSFALFSETNLDTYHEMILDNEWPAGASSPRASMQRVNGTWYTSNQGVEQDADGNAILGTPGTANELPTGSPNTCTNLPDKVAYDLDVVVLEDLSTDVIITVDADLWGVADGGSLIATDGSFTYTWTQGAWVTSSFEYDAETSNDCIDALELLHDGTENILQGDPSNVGPLPDYWPAYAAFLNRILQFQKSGLSVSFLPVIQSQ